MAPRKIRALGLLFDRLSDPMKVQLISEGSWASRMGILEGDVLVEIDGYPIADLTPQQIKDLVVQFGGGC